MSDLHEIKELAYALRRAATPPEVLENYRRTHCEAEKRRYARNPERFKAKARQQRQANPAKCAARVVDWRARHPAERKAIARNYYWRHRDKVLARRAARKAAA